MLFRKILKSERPEQRPGQTSVEQPEDPALPSNLKEALSALKTSLGDSADLTVHRFKAFSEPLEGATVYLKSLTSLEELNQSLLIPLQELKDRPSNLESLLESLPQGGSKVISSLHQASYELVQGNTLLLLTGYSSCLAIQLPREIARAVTEPDGEKVIRGPRDGFVESIWTNIGLVRQKIKDPDLRIERVTLGTRSNLDIGIVYVDGVANTKIVEEVRRRLKTISVDRMVANGFLQEYLADNIWTPFPTSQTTERPDTFAFQLLEGRVGIIMDGSPLTMLVPVVFWDFFKSNDDNLEQPIFVSFIRCMRVLSHLFTLLLPGAFVALTTMHLQMLPQAIALIIAGARTRAPLPTVIEILLMEVTVEILREAGLRMPGVFGQTISIIGALVLGEAAVTAGLVEPLTVIVVAFTTLCSFVLPNYSAAVSIRLLRFPLIILSGAMGFFGLTVGAMFYLVHLVSLRSFGVPYFAPLGPLWQRDATGIFVRLPGPLQTLRPTYYRAQDSTKGRSHPRKK